jgi:transcriptional regulator with XRE-family HTH domain
MAWKELSVEKTAKLIGVDVSEIREKHRLIELIKKIRKQQDMSQVELAKKIGVTQSRIAQIESKIGTIKVTLEVLLNILRKLGYEYHISIKKVA